MQADEKTAPIRVAGHFGEWLQGRLGPEGPVALVTLSCADLGVSARRMGAGPRQVLQSPQVLPPDWIARLFDLLHLRPGRYRLCAEMPPGGGAGASTAALVALARAGGHDDARALAQACLAVEGASDPLMMPAPDRVLWASRRAEVLAELPPPPKAEIIGGFWGPAMRTEPQDQAFPDISDLIAAWRQGVDLAEAARLASESARRCSAMRGPDGDPTARLARALGALGHVRAHTGSARGLVFAPGTVPDTASEALRAAGFTGVLRFGSGGTA